MGFRQFVPFTCFGRSCKEAPLAQLDRASGYEPEGREFESLRAHHTQQQARPGSRLSISVPSIYCAGLGPLDASALTCVLLRFERLSSRAPFC